MPNISFDIFFDQDFFNISASRSKHAPKAKPQWKVRTAPKLPAKEVAVDPTATPRPPARPTINSTRQPLTETDKAADKWQQTQATQARTSKDISADDNHAGRSKVEIMATQWILGKVSDALAPTVASACSSAGTFAGGAMNAVGSSINGVGDSINNSIRYYGDGTKDYGNAIMDWSKAPAARAQTASNPLGLSSTSGGGKGRVTTPSIYKAPAKPKEQRSPAVKETIKSEKATQKRTTTSSKKPSPAITSKAKVPTTQRPGVSSLGTRPKPSVATSKTPTKLGGDSANKVRATNNKNATVNPLGLSF